MKCVASVSESHLAGDEVFRCKRRDDFFEVRIATKRVPPWHQFQFAIGYAARTGERNGELLAGEILVTYPGSNHRQIFDQIHPVGQVLFYWQKLDPTAA